MSIKRIAVFPGQGSQAVGMGKELYNAFSEAKEVFQEVDEALNQPLSTLMFEGPLDELTLTHNAQPALMAASIAATRVLLKQSGRSLASIFAYVAGHSLGEYSALCAAGTVSLADTARLLRIRGNAMQEAVPAGQGSMVALVGATMEQAQTIAKAASEHGICQVANDNGGGQIVLSGATEAIDAAVVLAADHGIRRAVKLPVSAPFHSALMDPAAKVMEEALAAVSFVAPVVPLIANVTAAPTLDPEAIKAQLVEQVSGSVRWRESMEFAASEQVSDLVEIGSGKVLGGLMRRIASDVTSHTLGTPEGIEAFIHLLDAEKAA